MPTIHAAATSSRTREPERRSLCAPSFARAAVIFLTSVTALAMAGLALVLGGPVWTSGAPSAMAHEALARRFYTAVEDILAGGDPHALDALVAPDVVVHLAGRQLAGAAALERYVAATGAASPGQHVTATDVIASADRVVAAVVRDELPQPDPDFAIDGAPLPLAGTETFRLAGDRIVEYWSILDDQTLPRGLPAAALPLRPGMTQAALARFAFPPGAALDDLTAPGPHLLLPETGAFSVTVAGAARIVRADAIGAGWRPVPAEQEIALAPGDALLVPAGVRHAIHNDTTAGATLLGLLVYASVDVAGVRDLSPLTNLYASGAYGWPVAFGGASGTLVARGFDVCAGCQSATLHLVWLPLAPGQSIAPRRTADMAFLAVEAGAVSVDAARLAPEALPGATSGGDVAPRVVVAGGAVADSGGIDGPMIVPANAPARLVAIDIGPGASFSPATPAGS